MRKNEIVEMIVSPVSIDFYEIHRQNFLFIILKYDMFAGRYPDEAGCNF